MTPVLLLTALRVGASSPVLGQQTGRPTEINRGQDTSAQQAIRQVERDRRDAMLHGDAQALGRLLADDYIGTGAHGKVRSKVQVLTEYSAGAVKYESISDDDVTVRVYGSAAVVTGRTRSKGKEGRKNVDAEHRFTRVWVQAQGRWLLVASHSSPVAAR